MNFSGRTAAFRAACKRFFVSMAHKIDEGLFPEDITCDLCGKELDEKLRYRLCGECISKAPFVGDHICLNCGVTLTDESDYCIRCQNDRGEYLMNRSPLVYEGEAKELIYALKFGGKKYIVHTLGAMMADTFLKNGMEADIIVFVPMTAAEEKKRGFNQSELLARELGERLQLPVLPALIKVRETATQKLLTAGERAKNIEGAFACVFSQVKQRKLLLVDDVFTTGTTANECTKALLKAKAKEVRVLTAAVTKKKIPVESKDGDVDYI